MLTKYFDSREAWEEARLGRITGSKLKDLITKRGDGKKKGYYQLIADRLAIPQDGENVMDRGHRLEVEAIEEFTKATGKEVETSLVMWMRDDNDNIAISPDGFIGDKEAAEVKCLNSASHIEALLTNSVPKEYEDQVIQYFVVNDKLEKLYFIFYDPRLIIKQKFFYLEITRESVQTKVEEYIKLEHDLLAEVAAIVESLSEF